MCTQCCVDAQYYLLRPDGSVADYEALLPGWALFRAAKDGAYMEAKQWGLVRVNDPEFVWEVDPVVDPLDGASDDEVNALMKQPEIASQHEKFENAFYTLKDELCGSAESLVSAWALVESAKKVGYSEKDGAFEWWLCHRLGVWIRDHAPIFHGDDRIGGPHQ